MIIAGQSLYTLEVQPAANAALAANEAEKAANIKVLEIVSSARWAGSISPARTATSTSPGPPPRTRSSSSRVDRGSEVSPSRRSAGK